MPIRSDRSAPAPNSFPENFGTSARPIWTSGTPNRSANEFINGHASTGTSPVRSERQYYGALRSLGRRTGSRNAGVCVIQRYRHDHQRRCPNRPPNNPNAWIANQWYTFDPGLYDPTNGTTDNYNNTAPAYVRSSTQGTPGGTGPGPANYHGSPWQVHFTVSQQQKNQGQYVILSVGAVALDASLVVVLNGHSETWSYNGFAANDPMIRSGDAAFYQWAAFEFPTTDLNAAGVDDEFTLGVSAHTDGVMYDALRMEITNTSANPTVTGWHDYTYITDISGSTSAAANDAPDKAGRRY